MRASSLSTRGARAAASPLRIDYAAYEAAVENAYHPTENPSGALALNVAENRLSWHDLSAKIESITSENELPSWVPGYAAARGAPEFREAAASFLAEHLTLCPIDPAQLGVSAGATSVIEMTSFILANSGDVAVIPAPCYPVYRQDIGNMAGVERYDLVTHHELSDIEGGPALTLAHLDGALHDIEATGRRFRMLILTTPDNPTGGVYSAGLVEDIADWCIDHEIHLVVNEIYGLSLIDTRHPDLRADYPVTVVFESFANIMARKRSDFLHLWYAVSKDLGISGFRVGLVHSHNTGLLEAYENINLTHSVSNHTQWILQHLLTDSAFMTQYLTRNRQRLTESYVVVIGFLRRLGIPYVPSRGSLFVWLDLSEFMESTPEVDRGSDSTADSEASELGLWRELFETSGVLLTPGVGFGHSKRGLFRMVYSAVSREELGVAMLRLEDFVRTKREAQ